MEAVEEESHQQQQHGNTAATQQQHQDPPELHVGSMESDADAKQGLRPGATDTARTRHRRAAALAAPSVYAAAYSSPTRRRSNSNGDNSRKESRDVYPFQTLVDAFEKHMATKPMPLAARTIQMYRWMVGSVLRRLAESFPTLKEEGLPTWVRENVALVLSQYVEWEGQGWRHFLDFLEVPKEMTNVGRKRKVGGGRKPASERKVKGSGATAGGGRGKKTGGKSRDGGDNGGGVDGGGSGSSNQDKNDVLFAVEASASLSSMVASSSFTSDSSAAAAAAACTRKKARAATTTTPTKHTGEGGEGPVMSSGMLVGPEEEDQGGEREDGQGGVGETALLWTMDPPAPAAAPRGSNEKATGEEAEAEAEDWQQEGGDQKAAQAAAALAAPHTPSSPVSAMEVIQALRIEVVLLRGEKAELHANLQQQAEVMTKMQARLYRDVESLKEVRQHQQQLVEENEGMKQELSQLRHEHEQLRAQQQQQQQGPGTGVDQVGHQLGGVPQQQQQHQHDHYPVTAADLGASLQEHADLGTTDMFLLLPPGCGVDGLGRGEEEG